MKQFHIAYANISGHSLLITQSHHLHWKNWSIIQCFYYLFASNIFMLVCVCVCVCGKIT